MTKQTFEFVEPLRAGLSGAARRGRPVPEARLDGAQRPLRQRHVHRDRLVELAPPRLQGHDRRDCAALHQDLLHDVVLDPGGRDADGRVPGQRPVISEITVEVCCSA